ncbi:hypothetical protein F0U60_01980 [Archangium minus]|uniref:Outer membrane protein beta-barrel domain-containing protein n=1 Tax=Archangium minus TaxID=83450 RepID=A0ABY9WGS6_9BACT|nr:hypothetical protein F0U60_01980 [Archangium minus]
MRWTVCVVAVGLGLVPMTSRAQEAVELEDAKGERRTLVMALPMSGLSEQVGVGVEQAIGSHVALAGAAKAWGSSSVGNETYLPSGLDLSSHNWGVGVDAGVHFYVTGHAPEGFWVGPHVEMSMSRHSAENLLFPMWEVPDKDDVYVLSSRTVEYGGSARVGYTAIVGPGLTVQVGVGLAALTSRTANFRLKNEGSLGGLAGGLGLPSLRSWSVAPRMTVGLGWAF